MLNTIRENKINTFIKTMRNSLDNNKSFEFLVAYSSTFL